MQIYLDSASLDDVKKAHDLGVLDGVTTNPSLIAKEGVPYAKRLEEICKIVSGPVSAEVISTDYDNMMREGLQHSTIAPHIVVKLPCTIDGLRACKAFSDRGIKTNLTLCFQPLQALMVAKAGAFLVSPFIGRLDDIGEDGMELIRNIRHVYDNYNMRTKVLAASVRHSNHLLHCALAGADVATCPLKVITDCMKHPLTDKGIEIFVADYKKAFGS
jgi:transaldolase